jgi:hypothetical protein
MMLVVEKLQNSNRSGKNSSFGGIRRSVVDYVSAHPIQQRGQQFFITVFSDDVHVADVIHHGLNSY